MKVALITGIPGENGYYLAEVLLKNGYVVYGYKTLQHVDQYGQDRPFIQMTKVV